MENRKIATQKIETRFEQVREQRPPGQFIVWPKERLMNKPVTEKELEKIRTCVARNRPYGDETWQEREAKRFGLSHTLRSEGRPKATGRKQAKN